MANTVDARGLACPEPVLLTKKALEGGEAEYRVLVDSTVAKENVSRFAAKAGYAVQAEDADGDFELTLSRKEG